MSARQIAHVGILLLGVYLVVEAFARGVDLFAERPVLVLRSDDPPDAPWRNLLYSGAIGLGGIAILGLVPGGILIARSRAWSEKWFPDTGPSSELRAPTLFSVGLLLLGIHLSIVGLAGTVAGIAYSVAATEWQFASAWLSIASSVVYLIAGAVLFRFGRRSASNAA